MNRGCSGLRCRKFIEDDIGAFDADGVDFVVVDRRIFCDICILDAGGRVRSRQIIIDQIRPVGLSMEWLPPKTPAMETAPSDQMP